MFSDCLPTVAFLHAELKMKVPSHSSSGAFTLGYSNLLVASPVSETDVLVIDTTETPPPPLPPFSENGNSECGNVLGPWKPLGGWLFVVHARRFLRGGVETFFMKQSCKQNQ